MEKKKNNKHYIIPASYFKKKGITPIPVKVPEQKNIGTSLHTSSTVSGVKADKPEALVPNSKVVESFQVKETAKIMLKQETKRTYGLSLRSIRAKKEHLIKQIDVVIDEENLPKNAFTEKELLTVWNAFIEKLRQEGKHNLASILSIDTPKVKDTTIHLEFPNATNKVEVERQQYPLLAFIRKTLNNFDISLSISVNEIMEKKYAYTAQDKFEKLLEKNPNMDTLRRTFDLDF